MIIVVYSHTSEIAPRSAFSGIFPCERSPSKAPWLWLNMKWATTAGNTLFVFFVSQIRNVPKHVSRSILPPPPLTNSSLHTSYEWTWRFGNLLLSCEIVDYKRKKQFHVFITAPLPYRYFHLWADYPSTAPDTVCFRIWPFSCIRGSCTADLHLCLPISEQNVPKVRQLY